MEQSETPRPDEDRLSLPAKWRRHVPPRRGRDVANTDFDTAVDPSAAEAVARRIAEKRPQLDAGLARRANEKYAAAMTAHLEGRPDPVGAAAVMHLLESTEAHRRVHNTIDPAVRLRHLDAWVAVHGLAFAAAAVLESAMIRNGSFAPDDRAIAEGNLGTYLYWDQPEGWLAAQPAVHRLRSLLAAAPEAEYREAAAAVGARRTDPERRIGAALLLPTEADWVREAFEAGTGYFDRRRVDDWMLWSIAADPLHQELVERHGVNPDRIDERNLAPLLEGLGAAALPVLASLLEWRFARMSKPARAALMTAIGLLPSDEAVGCLVDRLALPGVLTAVMAAAERFPHRTLRAVAARAGEAGPAERERLAGVVRSSPALGAALPEAGERTREAVAALLDASDRVPDAPADALPPLLVTPPWKGKRRKGVVIEGLAPASETGVVWADADEERRWATVGDDHPYTRYDADKPKQLLAFLEEHPGYDHLLMFLSWGKAEDAEPFLDRWQGTASHPAGRDLMRLLGRFGPRVADRVTDLAKGRSGLAEVLVPIRSPAVARIAADWLARSKSLVPVAKRWFDRHADASALLLVPDALGGDAAARRAATVALRHLIAEQGAEAVTAAAKAYGEAAAEAIGALAATDPLDPLDARIPRPPAWATPTMLPQVILKGRESALPPEAVGHLTTVLALDSPQLPYAGVEVVTEACDPASLTRFSWKLFELWTDVGAPSKDGWAFTQLARFADDDTVAKIAALVRRWPGQGQHKRAVTGLEVLGAIGSETSLRALHGISRKVEFKALKEEAGRQIEVVAERLGLTAEQLADRLVPDFGLDGETSLVLDYGPRRFTVGFDEELRPFVSDGDGTPLKRLPKPGAEDDAAAAEAAYERFAQLKKDLRTVAKEQVRRLEHAMVAGRAWTVPEFEEFFSGHPLMRHLARRLVWLAETGAGSFGFRLAEDRTVADVEDDRRDLPGDASIRLAHPVMLGDRLADWAEVFADYEILQPFRQLARPVADFTAEELESGRITRFDGATLKSGSVLGLAKWGWRRGASNGWWVEPGFHYPLPEGGFVVVSLDPGIESYEGRVDAAQVQTVVSVRLSASADYAASGEGDHPTGVDAVTAAEVLGALTRITAAS
ncbi:DUF4132 domain-containing protein [Glycomyces sp. A-F 0318]|uniref:DUF4132 domain-containing protein n=1 Tax=Glycomyces amatae TaxID=2881355 RepID=UPI001E2F5B42|nr:DUF4132 domain-containing protein [Glycomyces amatae]MCD0443978.1 DUF4132 domain-containing protein [Glycomyces amatae]